MLIRLIHGHGPLLFVVLYIVLQLVSARVPITPLSNEQLDNAFKFYPGKETGGCNRNTPDGVPMLEHTRQSLSGASALAQTVVQELPNYSTQPYIRGLLYLFFGITFQWNYQLNPDLDNVHAFSFISSMI